MNNRSALEIIDRLISEEIASGELLTFVSLATPLRTAAYDEAREALRGANAVAIRALDSVEL